MRKPSLKRIEALFHQAADLPPEERSTFLAVRCAGDAALRAAVEELLKYDPGTGDSESFLASPIVRKLPPDASGGPALPVIPGYDLLGELGRGGMGIVYKARQTALNRLVALKMLLSGHAVTLQHLERFRTEVEALARLQHPHIVQIYEVGEREGHPYYSMEYVPGPSLSQQVRGMPQPVPAAAYLTEVVARAVHAVHQCGIIHRDLKPASILLRPPANLHHPAPELNVPAQRDPRSSPSLTDYEAKVSDFGLAKLVTDQPANRQLTEPGQAMGTPSYMAPEQAWGKLDALGPATDVYALGAILYELLTGKPPFEGETPTETILQLLFEEPVPPSLLRPKLPPDMQTVCLKCLEKEPRKRYASALELAEDLRRIQAGEPIKARPVSRAETAYRWCRRHPLVAALLAVTVSLAVAMVATVLVYNARLQRALVQRDATIGMLSLENGDAFEGLLWLTEALRLDQGNGPQQEKDRIRIATALQQCPRLVQLLVPDEPVRSAQLGTAGSWIITTGQDRTLHVWDVMAGKPLGPALELDADLLRVTCSPDGSLLATTGMDHRVRIWDRSTGKPFVDFLPHGVVRKECFARGGQILLTQRDDAVVQVWDLVRRVPRSLQGLPEGKPRFSSFSEDGRWVFLVDAGSTGRVWDTTTAEALAGSLKVEEDIRTAAISPDGRRIALITAEAEKRRSPSPRNQVRIADVSTGKPVGAPLKHPCSVTQVSFGPRGDRLLTTAEDHAARVWQVATGEMLIPPLRHDSAITQAQFSPDGRLVVSAGRDNKACVWEAATGAALTPPLKQNGSVTHAVFSADSMQLLTIGLDNTARVWEIPKANARADGQAIMVALDSAENATNPYGRRLAKVENGNAVRVIDASTRVPIGPPLRHASRIEDAVLSPDGRRVLTASDDNTAQLWDALTGERLIPPCQHKATVLYAAFRPDGRRFLTVSEDHSARVWDAATGEPLTPPLKSPGAMVGAHFSPDGSQLITRCADGRVRAWSLAPDDRPLTTLRLLAQVLSGNRVDEEHGVVPLDGNSLRSAWQSLGADQSGLTPSSHR